ncbi:MAG: tRNA pseudouridine(38-40) synthase TruA [Gammaproteobacteria bacterium]|nr:tRNA pseudouridine(38-40) synthase TruA [Gammaproteobacteria bacterium]NBT43488.1 tRNA pseudouridine(38-40) synthase TruA [Gammaproteobacteria bacterium]NBY23376.1 tRNA pseudouridine(38-40) synthase TruA [Gammaproteobacteria bacterium]
MRIALVVEYDGTDFAGWQWQLAQRTVQNELEAALSRVANHPVRVVCSGRTDAGVHALAQVVHFDTEASRKAHAFMMGTNAWLPADVRVTKALEVGTDFHARTSAIARHYRYEILNRSMASALGPRQQTLCPKPLDAEAMQAAANCLIGEHDFSSFRAQGCQSKSPIRFLHFIRVRREGERVLIDVGANAFLHHMVRNIVGSLMAVGAGKESPEWLAGVLAARNRRLAGITAPSDGLYFAGVLYPERFGLERAPIFDLLPADARRFMPSAAHELSVSLTPNSR